MANSGESHASVPRYKAVFFDLDGTLLDHDAASASGLRFILSVMKDGGHGPADSSWSEWKKLEDHYMESYLAGEVDFAEQRRRRLRHFFAPGLDETSDSALDQLFTHYLKGYEAGWRAFDDVKQTLEDLRKHVLLGVITNGDAGQQSGKLKQLGINQHFRFVFVPRDLGASKPDPRAFLNACKLAALDPAEVIYVGDRLDTDARAATKAGLTGVWLDRAGNSWPDTIDVLRITSLHGLSPLLTPREMAPG